MRLLLILIIVVAISACGRIETGNVGVRTDFNKTIETTELQPGWYGAVLTSVDEYVVKETELQLNDMRPKAKDNLTLADVDLSIFYTVNPTQVAELVIKYANMSGSGSDSFSFLKYPGYKLIERVARGSLYDTVAKFDSLTMHTKRSDIEASIMQQVQEDLDRSDKGVFTITKVVIRQVVTDQALEQSIQAAVQMQKQVEAKHNELELAKAEAARKIVEAQGIADSNDIIARSLTPSYLKYKEIEAMQSFAHEGTHTVVLPSGINPLVSIK